MKPKTNNSGLINNQPTNTGLKQKPKELDWEKLKSTQSIVALHKLYNQLDYCGAVGRKLTEEEFLEIIYPIFQQLLTQQRTELLEEIKSEKSKHTPNSGAGRVLTQLLIKLKK